MKKLFFVLFLFTAGTTFAQEGVSISKNRLTTKETPPVWPGCEDFSGPSKTCFKEKLTQHLRENYKFPKDEAGNYIRGKAIVSFVINKEGKPVVTKVEGPKKELNAEAKKIILAIPQMEPGQMAGKPVEVSYKVPFTF
ncbi:energy transducer TonB [Salinimicrobium tongyeongense]|jgi:protein TonB|uniref:Energy transducer TonB n=1 Tax=Salinimicrobium tongyeongense TaxID=2809707 RepID=A0ABY6NTE2_9FLAO|nr:energy transducer TonB [Salinimicrobium tongyeongense]UZH56182.1 energy transducer TonB [Salinimicrobium tongyeongense]